MVIGVARVVFHLPASHSLKDKRQVIRSLLAQVQREFGVTAAEVEEGDNWQMAVLGLGYISNSGAHADEVLAKAVHFMERRKLEAELVDYETEIIHAL